MAPLRVGTRSSRLALLQAEAFLQRFRAARPGLEAETVNIQTRADRFVDRRIHELGTGVFVREIDGRVLSGELDVAVHSLKDVPTQLARDLVLAAILPRGPRHDLLFSAGPDGLAGLPRGAAVGTSSVRRRAQLLRERPDLQVREIRGNIETRLRRVSEGGCAATVLSAAAIERLGLRPERLRAAPLDEERFLPAPGQGAIAVVTRRDSGWLGPLASLDDRAARAETGMERSVLRGLGAGCIAPVAVSARLRSTALEVRAEVLAPDGSRSAAFRGAVEPGLAGATKVVEELRRQGAEELIHEARP